MGKACTFRFSVSLHEDHTAFAVQFGGLSLHPVIHRRSERTGHTTIDRAVTVFVKAVLPSLLPPFIIRSACTPERERGRGSL